MELHQLRYLVAVVDHGSFTRAAEAVHVTQSGVSAQVAKLEAELGQRLLERGGTGPIRLTAAGEAVLPLARTVLADVEAVRDAADEVRNVVRGRVALGMVRGCSIPTFLDALADFRRDHEGVDLRLVEDDSDLLCRRVLMGELDLALVAWSGALDDGLVATTLLDEPVALVLPVGHRLARRRAGPRWRDLERQTVLCLAPGTGIWAAVDASGPDRRIDLEASSPETLLGLVRRGAGVAVLSATMAAGDPQLVARPLLDAPARARLGVVRRRGRVAAATRALAGVIVAAMTDPGDAAAGDAAPGQPPDDEASGAQQRP